MPIAHSILPYYEIDGLIFTIYPGDPLLQDSNKIEVDISIDNRTVYLEKWDRSELLTLLKTKKIRDIFPVPGDYSEKIDQENDEIMEFFRKAPFGFD